MAGYEGSPDLYCGKSDLEGITYIREYPKGTFLSYDRVVSLILRLFFCVEMPKSQLKPNFLRKIGFGVKFPKKNNIRG